METPVAASPTKVAKPAKKVSKAKTAGKKAAPAHPTYLEMIKDAIKSIGKPVKGATRQAIMKFISTKYKVTGNVQSTLRQVLRKLVQSGKLVQNKQAFKISKTELKPKKVKKVKAKKPKKPKKVKKPKQAKAVKVKKVSKVKKAAPRKKAVAPKKSKKASSPKKPKSASKPAKVKKTTTKKTVKRAAKPKAAKGKVATMKVAA